MLHDEDIRIKRRVREAHAAAGSPSYDKVAELIAETHPDLGVTKANVTHWFAQGTNSVAIPARALPALAAAFDVTVQRLLGVEDHALETRDARDELVERMHQLETGIEQYHRNHQVEMRALEARIAELSADDVEGAVAQPGPPSVERP